MGLMGHGGVLFHRHHHLVFVRRQRESNSLIEVRGRRVRADGQTRRLHSEGRRVCRVKPSILKPKGFEFPINQSLGEKSKFIGGSPSYSAASHSQFI